MLKVVPPDSWDFSVPPVALVKSSRAGLVGADYHALLDRSGHPLAQWVRENPPPPGEVYVHQIAMGSTERYGGNRNADEYSHRMLLRDHPTFEKFARAYREHRNTDPRRSYGVVRKAYYNPVVQRVELITGLNATKEAADRNGGLIADYELDDLESGRDYAVSMSCFPAGELVWLADGRQIPIEDVKIGDTVITHTGKYRLVNDLPRRTYAGVLVHLRVNGLPGELTLTANHRVWARPRRYDRASEDWVEADRLHVGCYVRTPLLVQMPAEHDVYSFVDNESVYRRVNAIRRSEFSGPVFNLSVDDPDHSYVVRGVAVANCHVPYDVCTACGNRARNRADYCGPDKCTKYGGCRDYLGRTFDDGFRLCVDNPICRFFDISRVRRGADPTAFTTGKVSSQTVVGGAELAETLGLVLPEHAADDGVLAALTSLRKLAALEANPPPDSLLPCSWDDVCRVRGVPDLEWPLEPTLRHQKLAALAEAGVILPPAQWVHAVSGVPVATAAQVFRDSRLSAADFLDRADRCTLLADALAAAPAGLAEKYAAYAPRPDTDRRLTLHVAIGHVKSAQPLPPSPPPIPPEWMNVLAARYLAYVGASLAKSASRSAIEPFVLRDALRYLNGCRS